MPKFQNGIYYLLKCKNISLTLIKLKQNGIGIFKQNTKIIKKMRESYSPQPSRFSIKTKRRAEPSEYSSKYYCSLLSIVFVSACIVAIIFEIANSNNTKRDDNLNGHKHEEEQTKMIVSKMSNDEFINQINVSHSISIPVVKKPKEKKCQITRQHQLEESLANIKIFELLHGSAYSHNDILERYFTKIMPLYAVKHAKFTSPRRQSQISITNVNWWNPFYDSQAEHYKEIDKIFRTNNKDKWVSSGKYLTIVSDEPIKPTYIVMNVPGGQSRPKNVHMFGISALEEVLANKNTLQSTFIKKISLTAGRNQIQCDLPECAAQYSMIMFVFDPVEIITIQLYTRKQHLSI